MKKTNFTSILPSWSWRTKASRWLVVTLFLAFGLSGAFAQGGPNCVNLNLSIGGDDSARFLIEEMVPNVMTAGPVDLTIKNEFGGTIFTQSGLALGDEVAILACRYIGDQLEATVNNTSGTCWSYLTMKQGNGKVLSSNLDTAVWCNDPLLIADPNDLSYLGWYSTDSPYTLLPTAQVPCGDDILWDKANPPATAAEARDFYYPLFKECGYFATDWIDAYPCEGDTSKIVIREWESFDKDGNRSVTTDTIIGLKLPLLATGSLFAPQKDTVHCFLDTNITYDLLPDYICWKQLVGLHTDGNYIYYPLAQVDDIIASLATFTGKEKELADEYIADNPVIRQAGGGTITLVDIPTALTDTAIFNGKESYVYGPVSRGDRFLTNGGAYTEATEEWEYAAGSHGYWDDFCIPTVGFGETVTVCDKWEEWKCEDGVIALLPAYPGAPAEEYGNALCLSNDILQQTKCFTVMHSEIKDLGGSCPRIVKKHFQIKQICYSEAGDWPDTAICIDEDGDTTFFEADDAAVEFDDPVIGIHTIEQWKMYVDTIAPILTAAPASTTWSAGTHDCFAEVKLPGVKFKDDCSGVKFVKATVLPEGQGWVNLTYDEESGYWIHGDDARTFQLACGEYYLRYEAGDECHNAADTVIGKITVVDNIPPTVITDDEIRVSLGGKDIWVDADRFDQGSQDNCGIRDIFVRRLDWETACGVNLCNDAIAAITTEDDLHEYIRDFGYTSVLTDEGNEVEEYYAEQYEWLRDDGDFCEGKDNYILHGWQDAILAYWAENCAPQDEHGNSVIQLDQPSTIGGGWGKAVPFCCADACEQVMVEVLVLDKECNYSKGWVTVQVEDKSPVAKACEFDEITVSCASYAANYKELVDAAVDAGNSSTEAEEEFAAIDEVLGALMKGWRSADNQLVDEDGNPMNKTFEYTTTECEYVIDTIKEFDTTHDGTVIWVTTYDTTVQIVTVEHEAQKGGAFVLCGARCEQDVWVELNDCGVGTVTRRWSVFSGCSEAHTANPLVYEQVINIVAGCELEKLMFDVPAEQTICTELSYDNAGNVAVDAGSLVYTLEDTDCRQLGIGYEDHVFEVAGQEDTYKIHRKWKVSDWCSGDEIECIQKIVISCDGEDGPDSRGNVTGEIATEYDGLVQNVTVTGVLADGRSLTSTTDVNGAFAFDVNEGASLTITPAKNSDLINGVDVADIVRIQRHILGRSELAGNFDQVAADVNNDGRVNGLDIIAIQQVTLGKATAFPGNSSWRFFSGVTGEESFQIAAVSGPQDVNFTAVKVGDVDRQNVDLSRAKAINFTTEDVALAQGQTVSVTLAAPAVDGYQFAIKYDAEKVSVLGVAGIEEAAYSLGEGEVLVVNAGDQSITLELAVAADANLSDVLAIGNGTGVDAKAVAGADQAPVGLEFVAASGFALYQNTPNPAIATTSIRFNLPETASATLSFFDVTGKVLKVVSKEFAQGLNSVEVSAQELGATGVVYYQLETSQESETKRLVFIE